MFALCDKILGKNILKPNRKLFSSYTFTCFDEIINVPQEDWTKAVNNKNVFLSHSYLSVLHKEKSEHFRFRYVIIYNRKNPIGVVYFQINDFPASLFGELIEKQISELKSKRASVFQRYIDQNEDETVMRLVTCGNNFISGEHGFYIDVNSKKTTFKLVEGVIDCVSRAEKLRGKISAILVKDFYEEGFGDKDCWYCSRFKHFNVEPNMIIDLPKGVSNLTEYINCFSKKYRNRAKRILSASSTLTKKRLSNEEISFYKSTMYLLYTQVFNQAKFKLAHLSSNYFEDVVNANTNSFYVDAWFLEDKMLSFACGFCLENEVEAHYIGFDYVYNREFELYQTILYSFIEQAILVQKTKINLGRTASEIKTTVGARAHELLCYIKPQNTVSKLILKPFMQFLQPTEWIPRNPFKEEI
jgi:hypothetical protein